MCATHACGMWACACTPRSSLARPTQASTPSPAGWRAQHGSRVCEVCCRHPAGGSWSACVCWALRMAPSSVTQPTVWHPNATGGTAAHVAPQRQGLIRVTSVQRGQEPPPCRLPAASHEGAPGASAAVAVVAMVPPTRQTSGVCGGCCGRLRSRGSRGAPECGPAGAWLLPSLCS